MGRHWANVRSGSAVQALNPLILTAQILFTDNQFNSVWTGQDLAGISGWVRYWEDVGTGGYVLKDSQYVLDLSDGHNETDTPIPAPGSYAVSVQPDGGAAFFSASEYWEE